MARPTWKPGSLTTTEAEGVAADALADLWWDCFRQADSSEDRLERYLKVLRRVSFVATGQANLPHIPATDKTGKTVEESLTDRIGSENLSEGWSE